jgi:hypothetical protein
MTASFTIRTFIAALLEMLRRTVWNFCQSILYLLSKLAEPQYFLDAGQTVSRTSTSVIWINIGLLGRFLCRIRSAMCIQTRMMTMTRRIVRMLVKLL